MASVPIVRQVPASNQWTWQAIAAGERIASVVLVAALTPVVAACAAAVSICSRRGPFIAHKRVGWRGETLWMLKLRTMWDDTSREGFQWVEYIDDWGGPELKQTADPRVPNRLARFLRSHSIDELPQLWHVVRGQMSLVGPRPVTAAELRRYYGPQSEEVLQVKPGIAGLWQTSGRNRLSYAERKEFDLQFVRDRSLGMYCRILLQTIPEVITGANSW